MIVRSWSLSDHICHTLLAQPDFFYNISMWQIFTKCTRVSTNEKWRLFSRIKADQFLWWASSKKPLVSLYLRTENILIKTFGLTFSDLRPALPEFGLFPLWLLSREGPVLLPFYSAYLHQLDFKCQFQKMTSCTTWRYSLQ
jgi:hypothetical protein